MTDLSTIEQLYADLTPAESQTLDRIKNNLRVALGRVYAHDLGDLMTDHVVREAIGHPTVIAAVSGVSEAAPANREGWDRLAVDLVSSNDLAQRNVALSREQRFHAMRAEELEALSGSQRINLARGGKLEEWVEARVAARLDRA